MAFPQALRKGGDCIGVIHVELDGVQARTQADRAFQRIAAATGDDHRVAPFAEAVGERLADA